MQETNASRLSGLELDGWRQDMHSLQIGAIRGAQHKSVSTSSDTNLQKVQKSCKMIILAATRCDKLLLVAIFGTRFEIWRDAPRGSLTKHCSTIMGECASGAHKWSCTNFTTVGNRSTGSDETTTVSSPDTRRSCAKAQSTTNMKSEV